MRTYVKTCVTSKDQPVYTTSMARVLGHSSLDNLETVKGTCHQQNLCSDYADAQADLRWSHVIL